MRRGIVRAFKPNRAGIARKIGAEAGVVAADRSLSGFWISKALLERLFGFEVDDGVGH